MWFEARKQEKKIRGIMIDHKKRAERRRMFYERIKKDPAQFMQIHGRQCKIYLESVQSKTSGDSAMRPWQGDPAVLIDRFDVRAHLDIIPEVKSSEKTSVSEEDTEECRCNYERYRILVANEFSKVSESKFLKEIYMEEHYGSRGHDLAKAEEEKKKQLASQKAAIGYVYEDSQYQNASGDNAASSSEEENERDKGGRKRDGVQFSKKEEEGEEEDIEDVDLDVNLDVSELSNEDCKELNTIAVKFQTRMGDYVKMMFEDKQEAEELRVLRDAEDEKQAMAGKKSRRERRLLKDQRLRELRMFSSSNQLSYIKEEAVKPELTRSDSSSDSSRSPTPTNAVEFITSFGDDNLSRARDRISPDGNAAVVLGPAAPPPAFLQSLKECPKSRSPKKRRDDSSRNGRYVRSSSRSSRSPAARRRHYRERTRSRSRERRHRSGSSNQRRRKSRSRSRDRSSRHSRRYDDHRRHHRSRSRSRSGSRRRRRSVSKTRRQSSRHRSRSSSSYHRGRRSRDRSADLKGRGGRVKSPRTSADAVKKVLSGETKRPSVDLNKQKATDGNVESQHAASSVSLGDDSKIVEAHARGASSESSRRSPVSDISVLSVRSSLSESEQERRQVENRRRRLQAVKLGVKTFTRAKRHGSTSAASAATVKSVSAAKAPGSSMKTTLTPLERLKQARQRALKKQLAADKKELQEKTERKLREEMEREEELRELALELRERHRERRRHERTRSGSSSRSRSRSSSTSSRSSRNSDVAERITA